MSIEDYTPDPQFDYLCDLERERERQDATIAALREEVERLKDECKRIEFGYNYLLQGKGLQDMIAERDILLTDNNCLRARVEELERQLKYWHELGAK